MRISDWSSDVCSSDLWPEYRVTFDAILLPRSDEQAASCRGVARSPLLPGLRPMARLTSCSEDGWPGREAERDQRLCATAVAFPPPCEREWQRGDLVVH